MDCRNRKHDEREMGQAKNIEGIKNLGKQRQSLSDRQTRGEWRGGSTDGSFQ